jgi:chromosome partitioning protein
MRPVITFANHKGGVGKTTSVVNIAAVWGELGRKVLVVDFDPQGSASLHFGVRDTGGKFLQAMEKTIALPVLSTTTAGVDLVACGPALSQRPPLTGSRSLSMRPAPMARKIIARWRNGCGSA